MSRNTQFPSDHAVLLRAICAGVARWEPFLTELRGEVCIGGLRYSTNLDDFGCPVLNKSIRNALIERLRARTAELGGVQ